MLGVARRTSVGGGDPFALAWTELGEGPPLLLVHGLGDSHRTWRRVASRLAKHFRVLLVDLPGHGLSDRPDAPYTLDWCAQILHEWLDAIGVETLSVAGHSYGGGVAQWMVLERPARVARLALVAPGGLGRDVTLGLRLLANPVARAVLSRPAMRLGTSLLMRLTVNASAKLEPDEVVRSAEMNAIPGTGRAFHRTVAGVVGFGGQHIQAWDRIHEVDALPPIAVFWGERDRILPVAHAYGAQKRIEGASLYTYPRAGHFVHIEASDAFADDLVRFLQDDKPAAPRVVDMELVARWNAFRARA
jgi:pimeloyl-ACP methyl ester carboxylesterase